MFGQPGVVDPLFGTLFPGPQDDPPLSLLQWAEDTHVQQLQDMHRVLGDESEPDVVLGSQHGHIGGHVCCQVVGQWDFNVLRQEGGQVHQEDLWCYRRYLVGLKLSPPYQFLQRLTTLCCVISLALLGVFVKTVLFVAQVPVDNNIVTPR